LIGHARAIPHHRFTIAVVFTAVEKPAVLGGLIVLGCPSGNWPCGDYDWN
jgi:hypothetical protein